MNSLNGNHRQDPKTKKIKENGGKIMKNIKRTLAAALASAMMITPCIAAVTFEASAAPATGVLQIAIDDPDAGHTYTAYRIFSGDQDDTDKFKFENIDWSAGINGTRIISDMNTKFTGIANLNDLLDWLKTNKNAQARLDAFATIVSNNINTYDDDLVKATANSGTISNLPAGYYLIEDTIADGATGVTDKVIARYILDVTGGSVTVSSKKNAPTLEKTITKKNDTAYTEEGEGGGVKKNTAAIGDIITYHIESTVPDMTGYDSYTFLITDTMDAGLTYNDSLSVSVGGNQLTADTDYTVTKTSLTGENNGKTKLEINFNHFINYTKDAKVVVKYTAKLNDDAKTGTEANINGAHLTYSNNPNESGEGTPSTSDTPESQTFTYTVNFTINKTGSDTGTVLQGAKFKLYKGTSSDDAIPANQITRTVNDVETSEWITKEDGTITIPGLDAGDYYLVETDAPGNYNEIDPISFTVGAKFNETIPTQLDSWTPASGEVKWVTDKNDLESDIVDKIGATLPGTGGIGTTLFYVFGGLLVAGGSVVLVTKKRMAKEAK